MDETGPYSHDLKAFSSFLDDRMVPFLPEWNRTGAVPRKFFLELGKAHWLGFERGDRGMVPFSSLKQAVLMTHLAAASPGVAVAVAVQITLGMMGVWLCGSDEQKRRYLESGAAGEILLCLGNTEATAGSDVAAVSTRARPAGPGWTIDGSKAYVTNGALSDMALITAVTDPQAQRNRRLSMFLVDLSSPGVDRKTLNKRVWIPSDLTRLSFTGLSVPAENLMGERGRGLHQVLKIFTHSRIPISSIALGTALGAFELAVTHAKKRKVFGRRIVDFQAKAFEIADLYARIEAARLVLHQACERKDRGVDFRLESSMAKYLTVTVAREVGQWAADLFGAASVIFEHPIHKYPLDAWAASLGEGTQDIQRLVIFRELMKKRGEHTEGMGL